MGHYEEWRLTHEKALKLKEEFSWLAQNPYPFKDDKKYDWFEIIVAPYDPVMRKDFLDRYLGDDPDSFDHSLLKQYKTRDYTVVVRYGLVEGPVEFTRPLLEIIREGKLPFDKTNYTA